MSMGMSSSASFNGMGIGEMRMPVDVNRLSKALTIVTSPSIKSGMGMGIASPDSPGGKKVNRGARLCEAATTTESQGGHGHGHGQAF
jgi:hypothetical protein